MDDFKVIRSRLLSLSNFSFSILKLHLILLFSLVGFCFVSCFPDMVRKKKMENDWFKLETVSYISQGRQLRILLKGFVKNSDLENILVYESEEDLPEHFVFRKDRMISPGQLLLKSDTIINKSLDWIRKIGTTRKWIRIELINANGMKTELLTEVLISESDKKVLRKDLSLEAEGEIIRLDGREWKVVSELNTSEQALLQYIPKTEFILFWTEMVSIHVYKVKSSQPEQIYTLLETTKRKDCPSVIWEKKAASREKISYFWEHSGCGKQSAMGEVAKLFRGEYGIYNIRYDRKGKISDSDRERWSELLEKLPGK